ncbi:hypothetical protein KM539_13520 [Xanthomonas translucens pv. poae]|uniref:hypothetical protein n=1 Tax=Xanthomonas graminis TaxID=3390026 RepID=UPI001112DD59|nr:hypothetical protein [Xanthomonas translucens]UKE60832.1 hypothetical protein KM539_13520 [Xanthomonas translucens pv. poae]
MGKKNLVFLPVVCSFLLLVGCTQQGGAVPADTQGVGLSSSAEIKAGKLSDSGVVSKDLVAAAVPAGLKEGMAYGDLRGKVISNNWLPNSHPNCKRDVIGADFERVCSSDPKLCRECDDLPELSECSGDGHCLMEFSASDGAQVLTVATYGDIRDAKVEGDTSGLRVSWWDAKPKK